MPPPTSPPPPGTSETKQQGHELRCRQQNVDGKCMSTVASSTTLSIPGTHVRGGRRRGRAPQHQRPPQRHPASLRSFAKHGFKRAPRAEEDKQEKKLVHLTSYLHRVAILHPTSSSCSNTARGLSLSLCVCLSACLPPSLSLRRRGASGKFFSLFAVSKIKRLKRSRKCEMSERASVSHEDQDTSASV